MVRSNLGPDDGIATLPPVARNDGGGSRPEPLISNGRLGMMLLVGTLTVLFGCFISTYMVLRMAAPVWPPAGTPLLTTDLSSFNTAVLLASAGCAFAARKQPALMAAAVLGSLFVVLQGVEFHRLYVRGLTLQTGPYGAVFYTLIGCHALHVLGGLVGWAMAFRTPPRVEYAQTYWYFVTAVWLVLFSILYIV